MPSCPRRCRQLIASTALAAFGLVAGCRPPAADDNGTILEGSGWSARIGPSGVEVSSAVATVRLGSSAVLRGDTVLGAGSPVWGRGPALEIDRGELVERFEATAAGLEQSWVLPNRPSGRGPLEVRIPVGACAPADDGAVWLEDPSTGARARYGAATWVDAAARRVQVSTRCAAGSSPAVVMTVPESELERALYPAVLDPLVSAPFAPDAPVVGPSHGFDGPSAAAWNGSEYFVAWHAQYAGVLGMRLDAGGALLDDPPILIAPDFVNGLAVASDGAAFLVAWSSAGDVLARRFDPAGSALDASPIALAVSALNEDEPSVAWNGSTYLVTWNEGFGLTHDVRAARVSPAGAVLDSPSLPVAVGGPDQRDPRAACAGATCLVAWIEDGTAIRGRRVDAAGAILDGAPIAVAAGIDAPGGYEASLAFDGASFTAVWGDFSPGMPCIHGVRVTPAGVVLDPSPFDVSLAPPSGASLDIAPVIVGTGSGSLVAWEHPDTPDENLHAVRLDTAGVPLDASEIVVSDAWSSQISVALAAGSGQVLASFSDMRSSMAADLYAVRIDASAAVLDPDGILVSRGDNEERGAAVATDGSEYLVVWSDTRGTDPDLLGVRVDASGTPIDLVAFPVAQAIRTQRRPRAAFTGSQYVVVWEDERELDSSSLPYTGLYAARVTPTATLLDPNGIVVLDQPYFYPGRPALACGADQCLVVWDDLRDGPVSARDVFAARLDASGVLLDPIAFAVSNADGDQTDVAVDWDGAGYFVVWRDTRGGTPEIYGARVTPAGTVLDPGGVVVSVDGLDAVDEQPAVAWDGDAHVVAWARAGNIVAIRVGADAIADSAASTVVSNAADVQEWPVISPARDGHNVVVAWEDHRNGGDDLYAAWLSNTGVVVPSGGLGLAVGPDVETSPVLASRGQGQLLVGYDRAVAATGEARVVLLRADSDALDGAVCASGSDCASGLCAEGFCCDRVCDEACESCAVPGSEGTCTCTGLATCVSNAACTKNAGLPCDSGSDCTSGFCADAVCCATACDEGCDRCDETPGTCTPRAAGELGAVPACLPGYVCSGAAACPTECANDATCAPGYYCSASSLCTPYCTGDADCPADSRCDSATGKCVSGATCDGDHTLALADGSHKDCAPYRCVAEGTCRQACNATGDCVAGQQCDEAGACRPPPSAADPGGGCGCRTSRAPEGWASLVWLAAMAIACRRRRGRP